MGEKQCLTDRKGKFVFKNVQSGQQSVNMEILPKQIVTTQSKPLELIVEGGKNNSVLVDVTECCTISGDIVSCVYQDTVDLFTGINSQTENLKIVGSSPIRGIECVVSGADEVYSTFSDEKGRFLFSNLRPGIWKVSVLSYGLPDFHYLNYNDLVLDLKSQDHKKVHFKALPVLRPVRPLSK